MEIIDTTKNATANSVRAASNTEVAAVIALLDKHCRGMAPGAQDSNNLLFEPDTSLKDAAIKVKKYMEKNTKRGMFSQFFGNKINFTTKMFCLLLYYCKLKRLS